MIRRQHEILERLVWLAELDLAAAEAAASHQPLLLRESLSGMADLVHDLQTLAADPGETAETLAAGRFLPGQRTLFGPMNPTE